MVGDFAAGMDVWARVRETFVKQHGGSVGSSIQVSGGRGRVSDMRLPSSRRQAPRLRSILVALLVIVVSWWWR